MSSVNSKLSQALFPLLTVTLLALGCDDSTAPSSGDAGATGPTAPSPTATDSGLAGSGPVPSSAAGQAPQVNRGTPGDTGTSQHTPAFFTRYNATYNPNWTTGMPLVRVPPVGGVQCIGNLIIRAGIDAFRTAGKSLVFEQYVVGETWFYGYSSGAWRSLTNGPIRSDLALQYRSVAQVPTASPGLVTPGAYYAVTRLTWFIRLTTGQWVQTATATYQFDRSSDYMVAMGATAGPGYCKAP